MGRSVYAVAKDVQKPSAKMTKGRTISLLLLGDRLSDTTGYMANLPANRSYHVQQKMTLELLQGELFSYRTYFINCSFE